MLSYADSSFLVSCYILDAHTHDAQVYLKKAPATLAFTLLHQLEMRNAFELGVFRRLLSSADAAAAIKNLDDDLNARRLIPAVIRWPSAFRLAAGLSKLHTATIGTRKLGLAACCGGAIAKGGSVRLL